jgi:putative hydrolase of the HAD superfamily
MIKALIFDMDDTLYDEKLYCRSGFAAVALHLSQYTGISNDKIFKGLWHQFETADRSRVFNAVLEKLGLTADESLIWQLVEIYRSHRPRISLEPAVKKILTELKQNYHIALLTDGYLPTQRLKAEALGLDKLCEAIIYTETLGRQYWKPHPLGYEKLIETLNLSPAQAAYIADNPEKDFIAPNKLGITPIQIKRPNRLYTKQPDSPQAEPKHIIQSLNDLADLIEKINSETNTKK